MTLEQNSSILLQSSEQDAKNMENPGPYGKPG